MDESEDARGALVATSEAWNAIGLELMRVDPKRFAAILQVAEDICKIHRDPLTDNVASGHFILTEDGSGDLS